MNADSGPKVADQEVRQHPPNKERPHECGAHECGADFEPRIIGFLCRWCAYPGADLAGTSRLKYPPNMVPVRVMCSGRVDPAFVLKALADGADGVLIAGCHPPADCHYQSGNIKAMRRYLLLLRTLEQFGIERERVRLEWISASEGPKFAQVMRDMRDTIKKLGPLNWNGVLPASCLLPLASP